MGATDLAGVLLIDKPQGTTSHDVDRGASARATGERRIGHAGTLDPMATGLLVVLSAPPPGSSSTSWATTSAYEARIVFGAETDTLDAEGVVTDVRAGARRGVRPRVGERAPRGIPRRAGADAARVLGDQARRRAPRTASRARAASRCSTPGSITVYAADLAGIDSTAARLGRGLLGLQGAPTSARLRATSGGPRARARISARFGARTWAWRASPMRSRFPTRWTPPRRGRFPSASRDPVSLLGFPVARGSRGARARRPAACRRRASCRRRRASRWSRPSGCSRSTAGQGSSLSPSPCCRGGHDDDADALP